MHKQMRMRIILAAVIAAGALDPLVSNADDLFQMFWRVNCYQKASNGRITVRRVTEQDFVNAVAQNNNLNPSDLVFVYRPNKHDTAVVRRSDGAFVADVIQMEYNYTDLVNPTGAIIVRHALLYDEAHQVALGSFFGVENRQLSADGRLIRDSLSGTVVYSKPDEGQVYSGKVSTGSRVADRSGG
jgi:hypothetical protein